MTNHLITLRAKLVGTLQAADQIALRLGNPSVQSDQLRLQCHEAASNIRGCTYLIRKEVDAAIAAAAEAFKTDVRNQRF